MYKRLIAEFLGTFVLSTIVLLSSVGEFALPIPVLAALTLSLFVYTIGRISGCHINPAVTLGLWSVRQITRDEAMPYVSAQALGGAGALILGSVIGIEWPVITSPESYFPYLFEFLGTLLFTFGIGSVVFHTEKLAPSGFIIGGSLLLGISLSVLGGGPGILNPAVALALKTSDVIYYVVEFIGAIIGLHLASYLSLNNPRRKR